MYPAFSGTPPPAARHLGPVHAFMAHMGIPPGATTVLLGVLIVLVLAGAARAALKSVFGGSN